jgi:microcystin-dependent protein
MAIKYLNKEGLQHFWSGIKKANVASATKLQTARTINGTSFNGTANITTANWGTARNIGIVSSDGTSTAVPVSVNGSGNINLKLPSTIKASLTGNSSSATKLQTARKINGVTFDGTKDISIPIPEVPIGSIMPYAGYEAPSGWVFCEGQSLNSSNYPELYKVIGNGYGGTTGADFKVPDLRGRVPVGKEANGNDSIVGRIGGEKVHQLTIDEMPIHKHPLTSWRNPGTAEPQPTSGFGFTNDDRGFANIATDGDGTAYTAYDFRGFGTAGGDRAHNNMQPYMILNYIIKAK